MLATAGTFAWNPWLASAVPGLDLVFRVPPPPAVLTNASEGAPPAAAKVATFNLFQPAAATAWTLPLTPADLLGSPVDPASYLRSLGQKIGVLQAGQGDAIDLSTPIDVDFLSVDGELLDRARLDTIFFMKGLFVTGQDEPADIDGDLVVHHSPSALTTMIARDGFLINRVAYDMLIDALTTKILTDAANPPANRGDDRAVATANAVASLGRIAYHQPLYVIAYLADLSGATPQLGTPLPAEVAEITHLLVELGALDTDGVLKLIRDAFAALFDFTLTTDGIGLQRVLGAIEINTDGVAATAADLALYDLAIDYVSTDADGEEVAVRTHFDWALASPTETANTWDFDFASVRAVFPARGDETLTVALRSLDGMVVWTKDYRAGNPALPMLHIAVGLVGPGAVSPAERTPLGNKRLRGQIVDLTRTAVLKDALVAVQVKAKDDVDWRIVGSSAADAGGNFSMAYPVGGYVAAQALVSLMPDTPVAIPVHADTGDGHTIADDFLFLLLHLPPAAAVPPPNDAAKLDCACDDTKASRLPDQTDLIRSDEYMQDLGNGCLSLSTPNRTLREYSYSAIVRTSDPDVANYTLTRDAGGAFTLDGGDRLIKRRAIGLANPVRWQDAPAAAKTLSFYQTVSVATGHILHYKSQFRADGYSLGDLLYSLPLAPGQVKQIAMFDASHRLTGSESQSITVGESLAANIVNDRSVADQLGGSIGEGLRGSSAAHTEGMSVGVGGAASMGSMGASLGIAGGFSNSNSQAAQDSSRVISQFFAEKLKNGISQNAESYRSQNATAVTSVAEGQGYSATTEVVSNHNHCHSLTMMYFEVLRHFAIYQELTDVEECVFVPLLMTNFTTENIFKFRDVLAASLLPLAANTYLPAVKGAHPLARGFDAIVRRQTTPPYDGLDWPDGPYCGEVMRFIDGTLQVTINLPRPKTKYDRILSLPLVNQQVTHQEVDPIETAKNLAVAPFLLGLNMLNGPAMKTVTETIQVSAQIFDSFMTMQPNYATVPPAQSIRVTNFDDVVIPISPLFFIATGMTGAPSTIVIPKDRFFDGNEADRRQWSAYASLMGYPDVFDFLKTYFKDRLISEWDTIFYRDIAPALFERIVDNLIFSTTPPTKNPTPGSALKPISYDANGNPLAPSQAYKGLAADFSTTSRYTGGTMRMTLNVRGSSSIARQDVPPVMYLQAGGAVANLGDAITFRLEDMTLHYTTPHYTGTLFSGHLGDDLQDGTLVYMPMSAEDQRNPRHEDAVLERTLIDHLNSNLEHYNKALWANLDPDRRYLLLDGFNIQVYNDFGAPLGLKSLASVVKNEVAGVAGNALVIPVAAGVKVSPSYVIEATETGAPAKVGLLDHYKPAEPMAPYRLSVPTRGVYAEAMMGQCNSCEKVEEDTSQDWTKFGTDTPTAINAITPATAVTTDWRATFKDLAAATVGFQKAPDAPAVAAGTAGLTGALTGPSGFKDITGLDKNQSNAMDTYKANNATVEKMASAAAGLASQAHNTANADKIQEGLDKAKEKGALSKDDHAALTKAHNEQQIDGGAAAKRKEEAAAKAAKTKPSLKDSAVGAVDKNKHVIATKSKKDGSTDTIEVKPSTGHTTTGPANPQPSDPEPADPTPAGPTAADPASTPAAKMSSKTVFFKSLDCYGDSLSGSFLIFYSESGVDGMGGVHKVASDDADTFQITTSSASPTLQFRIKTTDLSIDDDAPTINQTGTVVLKIPADQESASLVLQQEGESRAITTKEGKITAEKIAHEVNVGGDGNASGSAEGKEKEVTAKISVGMALRAAYKYATEKATTTSTDGTQTYNIILPTGHFKLIPSLVSGAAPATSAPAAPAAPH